VVRTQSSRWKNLLL